MKTRKQFPEVLQFILLMKYLFFGIVSLVTILFLCLSINVLVISINVLVIKY